MATAKSKTNTDKELRDEIDQLKNQVGDLLSLLNEKGKKKTANIKEKLGEDLEEYQEKAKEQIDSVYEMGSENMEKMGEKIQKNPLASILIAFSAGYVISKAMSKD